MSDFILGTPDVAYAIGSDSEWDACDIPIPSGMVIYAKDIDIMKRGNGTDLYVDLPVGIVISDVVSGTGNDVIDILNGVTDGNIIVINNETYTYSATTLNSIMVSIVNLNHGNDTTSDTLDYIENTNTVIDGTLTIIHDGKLSNGAVKGDISVTSANQDLHIRNMDIYTDSQCTIPASGILHNHTNYYVHVDGYSDTIDTDNLTFTLTSDQTANVTITHDHNGIYHVTTHGEYGVISVTFTGRVSNGGELVEVTKIVTFEDIIDIFVSVYGGGGEDWFRGVTTDANNNIICVGHTTSEGAGNFDTLVVKFDTNLNILAKKVYGGTGDDRLFGVTTDSNGNITCAGHTHSEGVGGRDALVVKFDTNLNILAKKVYGGTGDDYFHGVAIDSNDNVICAGRTNSEGAGGEDTLVVKFDSDLNILAKKIYGGIGDEQFDGITIDSNDNIICVGYTGSEGAGGWDALVVKYDSDLNILDRKIYGGTGIDWFWRVATDTNGNIICVGFTTSEGAGSDDALVVKFDSNLNILAKKIYGGAGTDWLFGVTTDANNNIICVGRTTSEGAGGWDAFVVKFDSNLNILAKKIYGGTGDDVCHGVVTDDSGNIICVGRTNSEGAGSDDALVVKFQSEIPTGTFVGTVLTNLTLQDSNLTLVNSNLTLADSNLTLADSNLTLANSNLTLADSNLIQELDTIVL